MPIGRTVRSTAQVLWERWREQAASATRLPVVPGDLPELAAAEPERAGVADVSQRGAAAGE